VKINCLQYLITVVRVGFRVVTDYRSVLAGPATKSALRWLCRPRLTV
jgi:hypothetical protein